MQWISRVITVLIKKHTFGGRTIHTFWNTNAAFGHKLDMFNTIDR